ncbi:hypothetical protein MKX03_016017, partial [Papaver bracteatum]
EDNGNVASDWNEFDDNDDLDLENDMMFELHDLNDVGYEDINVVHEDNNFNLNNFPH